MKYISTRGQSEEVDFIEACLQGLAPDGGLYVPKDYPEIAPAKFGESFSSIATRVISAMAGDSIGSEIVQTLCGQAFESFHHEEVTPLRDLDGDSKLLELFHGPTLAFKDVAMQFIARLFDYILEERKQKQTVICATSGDTGGAAAGAFAKSKNVSLVILHPNNRISSVQRKFMTCWGADNILNLAVESDFDACQGIVKTLFGDHNFVRRMNLSGVNSINWARIAVQMTYYAYASARMQGDDLIRFVVPTGNFGDAFAGYVARRTGMLEEGTQFLCAVNENKVLEAAIQTGQLSRVSAKATNSPAMDISVPSNFERLLFEMSNRDSQFVREIYDDLNTTGAGTIPFDIQDRIKLNGIQSESVTQQQTIDEIRKVYRKSNIVLCPHTAVAVALASRADANHNDVVLATAHPAKFPEVIGQALGTKVEVPQRHASQIQSAEKYETVENSSSVVRERIENWFAI